MRLDYKEARWAVLPVASLWASLDYKSVANSPIRVSRILYLILLISEINERTIPKVVFIWAKRLPITLAAATGCEPTTIPRGDKYIRKVFTSYTFTLNQIRPATLIFCWRLNEVTKLFKKYLCHQAKAAPWLFFEHHHTEHWPFKMADGIQAALLNHDRVQRTTDIPLFFW